MLTKLGGGGGGGQNRIDPQNDTGYDGAQPSLTRVEMSAPLNALKLCKKCAELAEIM